MNKSEEILALGKDIIFLIEAVIDEKESINDEYQLFTIVNLSQIKDTISGLLYECLPPEIHKELITQLTTTTPRGISK